MSTFAQITTSLSGEGMELVIPEHQDLVAAIAASDVDLHEADVARARSGRFLAGTRRQRGP